jgi:hypothetical protein
MTPQAMRASVMTRRVLHAVLLAGGIEVGAHRREAGGIALTCFLDKAPQVAPRCSTAIAVQEDAPVVILVVSSLDWDSRSGPRSVLCMHPMADRAVSRWRWLALICLLRVGDVDA